MRGHCSLLSVLAAALGGAAHAGTIDKAELRVGITDARKQYKVTGDVLVGQIENGQLYTDHLYLEFADAGRYTLQPGVAMGTAAQRGHASAVAGVWLYDRSTINGMLGPARTGEGTTTDGASVKAAAIPGFDGYISGLDWLLAGTAPSVVNESHGWPDDEVYTEGRVPTEILDYFAAANPQVTYVTIAGNYFQKPTGSNHRVIEPGDAYNVITVGRTGALFNKVDGDSLVGPTEFGGERPAVDIVAPGSELYLPSDGDSAGYGQPSNRGDWNGTSFAAPVVTAGVAIMQDWADDNGGGDRLDHRVLKSILLTTADKDILGNGHAYGGTTHNLLVWARNPWQHGKNRLHLEAGAGQLRVRNAMDLLKPAETTNALTTERGWMLDEISDGHDAAHPKTQYHSLGYLGKDDVVVATLVWDRPVERIAHDPGVGDDEFIEPTADDKKFQELQMALLGPNTVAVDSTGGLDRATTRHLVAPIKRADSYSLRVNNQTATGTLDYAVSWRIEPRGNRIEPKIKPKPAGGPQLVDSQLGAVAGAGGAGDVEELGGPSDPGLVRPRPNLLVPDSHDAQAWSRGRNDVWSLATPDQGGRVFFSVDEGSVGMPPSTSGGYRIDNDVNSMAQLGFASQNTYFSAVLIRPSPSSPVLAANGANSNFIDQSTPDLRFDLPVEFGEPSTEFGAITAMEDFGGRRHLLADDRDLAELAGLDAFTFFTIGAGSDLIGQFDVGDVIVADDAGAVELYAAHGELGLLDGTVVDALAVDDDGLLLDGFPTFSLTDRVLFSIRDPGFTMGADLLLARPGESLELLVPAFEIGLGTTDDVIALDLLDHVPAPGALALFGMALVTRRRRRRPRATSGGTAGPG